MGSELRISVSLLRTELRVYVTLRSTAACRRLTDTLSPGGDVIGQYAACRIDALWFFGLMCGTVVLLIVLSACGFWDCCFVLCFCFSLCQRIFNCCLRSFALARATKWTKLKSKPSIALKNPAALERLANFLVLWSYSIVSL